MQRTAGNLSWLKIPNCTCLPVDDNTHLYTSRYTQAYTDKHKHKPCLRDLLSLLHFINSLVPIVFPMHDLNRLLFLFVLMMFIVI